MKIQSFTQQTRRLVGQKLRAFVDVLPPKLRGFIYRQSASLAFQSHSALLFKVAETKDELEQCFRILHNSYVDSGFMTPHESQLRVTIYHALPTTTTLCAKLGDRVVGTITLIRQNPLGLPIMELASLDQLGVDPAKVAEISALAVDKRYRGNIRSLYLPLMKFMYDYCTNYFATTHVVIAVNPRHIGVYENMFFFKRIETKEKESTGYSFVNGAPAICAALNLLEAPELFSKAYKNKEPSKNMYTYFMVSKLENVVLPRRRYRTTNDPVMTPKLLDYFFNKKTKLFKSLPDRKKELLSSIYHQEEFDDILPVVAFGSPRPVIRHTPRYSFNCTGVITSQVKLKIQRVNIVLNEVSANGFQATCDVPLENNAYVDAHITLGQKEISKLRVRVNRDISTSSSLRYAFLVKKPDLVWRKFIAAVNTGNTSSDLESASEFLHEPTQIPEPEMTGRKHPMPAF